MESPCFTASTYIDPSDSLFGAFQVLRIVGKNAMRSISVARITDHKILLLRSQGRIEMIAKTKQILSKFVISFVPYLPFRERNSVKIVTIAATPVAHDPGPPAETHCPQKAIVVTIDQISQVYV
ncbi:MAG: hypothetical protein JWP09_159 [Candidatus Taylorbacteria bacterium]|nr:hypothetical protein [Candidatus Taylorbacteria bacterium]